MALCSNCTIPNSIGEFISVENIPRYCKQRCNIFHALEALKQNILLKEDINWKLLWDVIEELDCRRDRKPCTLFLLEICKLFEKYSCKDTRVILTVLKLLYYSNVGPLSKCYVRPIMEENVVDQRYFFNYLYVEDSEERIDYVWSATIAGNVEVLKVMLKFGMRIFRPKSLLSIPYTREIFSVYGRDFLPFGFDACAAIRKMDSNCNHRQRNRIDLVKGAMRLLLKIELIPFGIENFVMCYELLFSSINDPYVSGSEMRTFLQNYLPPQCKDKIHEIVEKFKNIFPEGNELPQPRTLQHLCRVQIRESLRQNINLPYGVPKLMLPKLLKKYILLNDDGDYSKTSMLRLFYPFQSLMNISDEKNCVLKFLRSL